MTTAPSSRPPAYVGVSGVISPAQADRVREAADRANLDRPLLLGVKATHKTQFLDVENKYGRAWYPFGDQLTVALGKTSGGADALRVAQVYLEPALADDRRYRDEFMARLLERGSWWLTGVQFDMLPWHTAAWASGFLADLRARGLTVLLQAHAPAMAELGPRRCAGMLGVLAQEQAIDYVLFDASHGTGKRLDASSLRPFVAATYDNAYLDGVGLAVAGGLDQHTVFDLRTLELDLDDISWDAEGRLHPELVPGAGRPLDLLATADYLDASARLLGARVA